MVIFLKLFDGVVESRVKYFSIISSFQKYQNINALRLFLSGIFVVKLHKLDLSINIFFLVVFPILIFLFFLSVENSTKFLNSRLVSPHLNANFST